MRTASFFAVICGSPPIARRARPRTVGQLRRGRLTSARAESTPDLFDVGVNVRITSARAESTRPHPCGHDCHRITSARAESTSDAPHRRGRRADHLRSRGEHLAMYGNVPVLYGSPPLARGGRIPGPRRPRRERLTSARAESTSRTPGRWAGGPAHLRSRGEHRPTSAVPLLSIGSSPLARRAHRVGARDPEARRLTSARAESTDFTGCVTGSRTAHLRSREEHRSLSVFHGRPSGSPPLARRAPGGGQRGGPIGRLTSALAESTCPGSRRTSTSPVHLRSRGEHADDTMPVVTKSGSPPLARRALLPALRTLGKVRFTSARAERHERSSSSSATIHDSPPLARRAPGRRRGSVHLRSRGEHVCPYGAGEVLGGSPPLARRAHGVAGQGVRPVRLTSARAERTIASTARPATGWLTSARAERTRFCQTVRFSSSAHLRSRGEHVLDDSRSPRRIGSPPLARRAPPRPPERLPQLRITSARAESTPPDPTRPVVPPARLRSRGEHEIRGLRLARVDGSPPLARRAPDLARSHHQPRRHTSARAESTDGR